MSESVQKYFRGYFRINPEQPWSRVVSKANRALAIRMASTSARNSSGEWMVEHCSEDNNGEITVLEVITPETVDD